MRIEWTGTPGKRLDGADIHISHNVVVELATLNEDYPYGWGVWGVRIDDNLYREPRDMEPEPLADGPFLTMIEEACQQAARYA